MKNALYGLMADGFAVSAAAPLPGDVFELVKSAVDKTMVPDVLKLAASGDAEGLEALGRSIAVEEGKLLEAVVIALAHRNEEVSVLTGMKLPVADAALAIIEHNGSHKVQTLSIDPESKARRTYYPDLVLANRSTSTAIVLDVKRSIASYLGGSKLVDLKIRMQAAGLSLPDTLWRDHDRLAVNHVSVGIIDGSKTDGDASNGIWSLSQLDELLGVPGAGMIAQSAIASFRAGIGKHWKEAIQDAFGAIETPKAALKPADNVVELHKPTKRLEIKPKRWRGRPRKHVHTVTVGLLRPQSLS